MHKSSPACKEESTMTARKYARYVAQPNRRTLPANRRYQRWTVEEDKILYTLWVHCTHVDITEKVLIAQRLGRTLIACMRRYQYLAALKKTEDASNDVDITT